MNEDEAVPLRNQMAADGVHTKGQTWGALRRSWTGYRIAKAKNETENMKTYATQIRALQQQLGVTQSKFPEIGIE